MNIQTPRTTMILLWLITIVSLAVIEVDAMTTGHERVDSSEPISARVVLQEQVYRKRRSIDEDNPGATYSDFPETLDFSVTVDGTQYDLHLTKSNFVKHDIKITSNEGLHDHDFKDRFCVYESLEHMAAVVVECPSNRACTMTGVMDINGQSYSIEPITESPDLTAHQLRKRAAWDEDENNDIEVALKHDFQPQKADSTSSDSNKDNSRRRRETLDYDCDVFEVKFLLDYDVWIYFLDNHYNSVTTATEEIWKFYTAIFAEVNLRFKCITKYIDGYCPKTPNCQITCLRAVLVAIEIQTTLSQTWTSQNNILFNHQFPDGKIGTFADAWKSLEYCGNYRNGDPDRHYYDILFCPTRKNIAVTTNNQAYKWPRAYTYLKSACMNDKRYSAVAIETKIDRMDLLIARNLMYSINGFPCDENEPSLMFRNEELVPSYWHLNWYIDDCTAEDICHDVKTMNDNYNNCLREHYFQDKWDATLNSPLLGGLYTADQQCQIQWGSDSYQCDPTGNNNMFPEYMCSRLIHCHTDAGCVCFTRVSSYTPCGYAKYCLKGHCQTKPDQDLDDECLCHDQCADANAICDAESLTCQCKDTHYNNYGVCDPKSPIGGGCHTEDQCLDDVAICIGYMCVCPSIYYNDNGVCMPKICLGNPCNYSDQCEGDNTECDAICVCLADYFVNEVGKCIHYPGNLDDPCSDNNHCSGDLVCGTNYDCECPPPFLRLADQCVSCLGGYCHDDADCTGSYTTCFSGTCICETNYFPTENGGECQQYPGYLDDPCTNNNHCDENLVCGTNNDCECPPYFLRSGDECVSCLGGYCSNDYGCIGDYTTCDHSYYYDYGYGMCVCIDGYFPNEYGQCIHYDGNLGDPCDDSGDCAGIYECDTTGLANNCVCPSPYVQFDNECMSCLGGYCSYDNNCIGDYTTCYSGMCVCMDGYFPDPYGGVCIYYPGNLDDPCSDNNHCSGGLVCGTNYDCECPSPFLRLTDQCVSCLGGYCHDDADCTGSYTTCFSGTCICETNYFPTENGGECQQYPGYLDDPCSNNGHCYGNLVCGTNNDCECPPPFLRSADDECVSCLGGYCSNDYGCIGDYTTCDHSYYYDYGYGMCVCIDDYFPNEYGQCIHYDGNLGDPCDDSGDCAGIYECDTTGLANNCVCPSPYVQFDNECMSCLGGYCSYDYNCIGDYTTCYSGMCVCMDGYFPDPYGGVCIYYPGNLDDPCSDNNHCSGDLVCGTNYDCECPLPFLRLVDQCVSCLGGYCHDDADCTGSYTTCFSGTCICETDYFPTENGGECQQYPGYLDDPCSNNVHCYGNLVCGTNNDCECPPPFLRSADDECVSCLGGSCTMDEDCIGSNTVCFSGICICAMGYFPDETDGNCVQYPGDLCDPCNDDTDCVNLVCGTNGHCQCLPGQIQVGDTCYDTSWGSSCSTNDTCTDDPYLFCNGSICVCSHDFTWSGSMCVGTHPCDPCDPDDSSSVDEMGMYEVTTCDAQTHICHCGASRVSYKGECYGRNYNEPCTQDFDTCYAGDNLECGGSKCDCKPGFNWHMGACDVAPAR